MPTLTTEQFKTKANAKHGNKFTYPDPYIHGKIKIRINCREHGDFLQVPRDHLNGRGCYYCGRDAVSKKMLLPFSDFIDRSNTKHNSVYDYSKFELIDTKTKGIIICPNHGEFKQAAKEHMKGDGCPKCRYTKVSALTRRSKEEFVTLANIKHNNFYSYHLLEYLGGTTKGTIVCPLHGEFEQIPTSHLAGKGCKNCAITKNIESRKYSNSWSFSGWADVDPNSIKFKGFSVYVLKCYSDVTGEVFYKIGKTRNSVRTRWGLGNNKTLPYSYELLKLFEGGDSIEMSKLENTLREKNKATSYTPELRFHGMYECYSSILPETLIEDEE